ncbi:MAG: copper amine oxidase N-terminal domain-containing protein [Oscillospiraceae bacterium]|nr:copper amine oxidase N-terminal domain-containing protein [Oscillospiraceae bacterium]
MKTFKGFIAGVIATLLVTSLIVSVFAEPITRTITATFGATKYFLDGEPFEEESLVYNGVAYLPAAYLAEKLGLSASWDSATNTTSLTSPPAQTCERPHIPEITVLSAPSEVKRNDSATIAIRGIPNTEYILRVYYENESVAEGLGAAVSDDEGYVSWTWHVGGRTNPRTDCAAVISYKNEELHTHYFAVVEAE